MLAEFLRRSRHRLGAAALVREHAYRSGENKRRNSPISIAPW
jgi:hypothetical protein